MLTQTLPQPEHELDDVTPAAGGGTSAWAQAQAMHQQVAQREAARRGGR